MALAAKYLSGVSTESVYSCTFPDSPVRINLPLDLISRLRTELGQNESLRTSPDTEVGGVLLGRPKKPNTLEIEDYVWVSSGQPGSRYLLDPSELERLRSFYTFVVGYFRTQPEDELHLRNEEITFVGKHFTDPTNAVLLINTSRQPYTAGVFGMNNGVLAPTSFRDFRLDAELLRIEAEPSGAEARVTQPAQDVEMTLPLLASSGKDVVAYVDSAFTSPEEPIFQSEAVSGGQRQRSLLERLKARLSTWEAVDEQLEQDEPTATTPPLTAAALKKTRRRRVVTIAIACAALLFGSVSASLLRSWISGSRQETPVTTVALPLQLVVEAQGNGLNIRWNPQSRPLAEARAGRLVIVEGDKRPRIISLNPQLLTSGHVFYRSSADRLQFQLEIVDHSGKVVRESVLALSSKP